MNLSADSKTSPPGDSKNSKTSWTSWPKSWWVGSLVIGVAVLWSYFDTLKWLASRWMNEPDYSHGFLVPVFAGYLLWYRRGMMAGTTGKGNWWGLLLIGVAAGMRWVASYYFYSQFDAPSLLFCLAGVAVMLGGWQALRWSWPAIGYLIFMIPLPAVVASALSGPLQNIATVASTWLLQTLGVPAVARGNVISLTNAQIGVVEACSGLRMLMLFSAITVGASFLIQRPLWEKVFVAISALGIALITNIFRITVTAFLHEYVGKELAEKVFHDLAGLLMMPTATLLLMLELYVLSKLLIQPERPEPVMLRR